MSREPNPFPVQQPVASERVQLNNSARTSYRPCNQKEADPQFGARHSTILKRIGSDTNGICIDG